MLTRLAGDEDDNVVEAALPALRGAAAARRDAVRRGLAGEEDRIVARDRCGRIRHPRRGAALASAAATPALVGALSDALERITDERCETSRDAGSR